MQKEDAWQGSLFKGIALAEPWPVAQKLGSFPTWWCHSKRPRKFPFALWWMSHITNQVAGSSTSGLQILSTFWKSNIHAYLISCLSKCITHRHRHRPRPRRSHYPTESSHHTQEGNAENSLLFLMVQLTEGTGSFISVGLYKINPTWPGLIPALPLVLMFKLSFICYLESRHQLQLL